MKTDVNKCWTEIAPCRHGDDRHGDRGYDDETLCRPPVMSSAVRGSGSATAGSGLTLSTNTYVQGANMGSVPGMFPLGDGSDQSCTVLLILVCSFLPVSLHSCVWALLPHAGCRVVRIDPLRFLAGCRTRRLNLALSVLYLSLGFLSVSVVLLTRAPFSFLHLLRARWRIRPSIVRNIYHRIFSFCNQ